MNNTFELSLTFKKWLNGVCDKNSSGTVDKSMLIEAITK